MPFNGSGVYSLPAANYPAVANTLITAANRNAIDSDIATALTTCITKDGQTVITANLPMAGFRHTGVGNASARSDYAAAGQVQDGSFVWCGTAGGTKNALTLTPSPAITSYAAGQRFIFKAGATSSDSTVTVAISGLSTIAVQVNGAACSGGEVVANKFYEIVLDTTSTAQLERISGIEPRMASYQWTAWTPADNAGTETNAPSTAVATSTATNYLTMANASGTVTFTAVKAGVYHFTAQSIVSSGGPTYTYAFTRCHIAGTATILTANTGTATYGNAAQTESAIHSNSFAAVMTVGQTVTIRPTIGVSSGSAASNFGGVANATASYMGTS